MEEQTDKTDVKEKKIVVIDVKKWLSENELIKLCEIFSKRNVKIEELCEFDDNELKQLSKDMTLDMLDTKRFMKAVHKLQKQLDIEPNTYIAQKKNIEKKNKKN